MRFDEGDKMEDCKHLNKGSDEYPCNYCKHLNKGSDEYPCNYCKWSPRHVDNFERRKIEVEISEKIL